MNKNLINQLPADEQPVASELNSIADHMQLSPTFQWELENQLMDIAKSKMRPAHGWAAKIVPTVGWAIVAVCAVLLLNWTVRSMAPGQPSAPAGTPIPELSFADSVRRGDICEGPLALANGFNVFLTNEDKTGFVPVDTGNTLDELRSFAWSPDGERLALIGNTAGQGKIYIIDFSGQREYLLYGSEIGYLRDGAWSRNGRQLVLWSSQNITTLYLLSTLGHGLIEKQLDVQIFGTPQFTPDGGGIFFYGADKTGSGLFILSLEDSQPALVISSAEDESGFAFSPDGSLLAYIEYDRDEGEARLSTQRPTMGEYRLLGTLPIPRNPGASLPESANLSWSPDGKSLVFEFGRHTADRAIYLAYADGAGPVKLVDSAYAPTISADGICLAYISNKQVFLLDLTSTSTEPVLLADLPAGRGSSDFRLDKLGWRP